MVALFSTEEELSTEDVKVVNSVMRLDDNLFEPHRVNQSIKKALCPRRGLSPQEAALYIAVSASLFDELVKSGGMPKPLHFKLRTMWDRHQLDDYFEAFSGQTTTRGTRRDGRYMVTPRLRYVVSDRDRHGNIRYYFRRKGEKKVRLHGRGSFGFVCQAYYASAIFRKLDVQTQSWRRRVLEEICSEYGTYPIAGLQARHVRKLRNQKSELPSASDARLKALRALFKFALEEELVEADPTIGVKSLPHQTEGECGATTLQIMAITGHRSIAEVERYTRKAGRTKLADGAMAKFKPRT